jgi:hypothetical protein
LQTFFEQEQFYPALLIESMIIHDLYLSQMQTTDGTVLTLLVGLALMYFDLED